MNANIPFLAQSKFRNSLQTGFDAVYESNQGSYLARWNESFILVQPTSDGFIPREAMFAAPYTNPVDMRGKSRKRAFKKVLVETRHIGCRVWGTRSKNRLSQDLSDYLWPSGRDSIRVQLRSTDARLLPHSKLNIVLIDTEEGCSETNEYCLAACENGTVTWLRYFECVQGNRHIWTVHLFDRRVREVMHPDNELGRLSNNNNTYVVINNNTSCVINYNIGGNVNNEAGTQKNYNIGGNVNNEAGTQKIGSVTVQHS